MSDMRKAFEAKALECGWGEVRVFWDGLSYEDPLIKGLWTGFRWGWQSISDSIDLAIAQTDDMMRLPSALHEPGNGQDKFEGEI